MFLNKLYLRDNINNKGNKYIVILYIKPFTKLLIFKLLKAAKIIPLHHSLNYALKFLMVSVDFLKPFLNLQFIIVKFRGIENHELLLSTVITKVNLK